MRAAVIVGCCALVAWAAPAPAGAHPVTAPRAGITHGDPRVALVPGDPGVATPYSRVQSVSCPSPGTCAAGGNYRDRKGRTQAFVVSQVRGSWTRPHAVTGPEDLNVGGNAAVESVSCASAGNCSAGGWYSVSRVSGPAEFQAFVVSQAHGRWGKAIEVPGTAALNGGLSAQVGSVSCTSSGNCVAGGYYSSTRSGCFCIEAFVVSEVNGHWEKAINVPGIAVLNVGNQAGVTSVSCASSGNCSAGGWYSSTATNQQAFVVSEVNGHWQGAIEVPGTATLNTGGHARLAAVSCASAGNCAAVGWYGGLDTITERGFVVSQVHGAWGTAVEVPGITKLNQLGVSALLSVSCPSPGNCGAGGWEAATQGLVVSEIRGHWRSALRVPRLGTLNAAGYAAVTSVSCASAGNCSAAGYYDDASRHVQGFVVNEVRGHWGQAQPVRGLGALNVGGYASVASVSCASPGDCSAGGSYAVRYQHALVVSERNGHWVLARKVF